MELVQYKKIHCSNCGGIGHIHRQCNHPISSYGIICFRLFNNNIQYLLVQRKDSLSYIEFLRGKYTLNQKHYIMKLIANMTEKERNMLTTRNFSELWKSLWQMHGNEKGRLFQKEYNEAKIKFDLLRTGYILKNEQGISWFSLKYIMDNTTSHLTEAEWGFPKGRRNINENDYVCALREFKEETNMSLNHVSLLQIPPYEEVFTGSNHVRYRHIYYVTMYNSLQKPSVNPDNKLQCREIKDVRWFSYEEAQDKIRDINIERKELFKRVNNNIKKIISKLVIS